MKQNSTILEPAREIPLYGDYDVVVCGGGPAGFAAAVAAGRNGAKTLVIENQICFGGQATAGLMGRLGPYHDQKKFIVGGIPREVLDKLVAKGDAFEPLAKPFSDKVYYWLPFDPESLKFICDQLIEDAGVDVVFAAIAVESLIDEQSVKGVIFESKSGRYAVTAKVVIDATGDGDIAVKAGAPFEFGRPSDHKTQPVTLEHIVQGLPDSAREYLTQNLENIITSLRKRGESIPDYVSLSSDNYLREETRRYNMDHVHGIDTTDLREFSKAVLSARRKAWSNVDFLRRYVPGCSKAFVSSMASIFGVRETRRIMGDYVLTAEDVMEGRHFDDDIVQYHCYIDIHPIIPGEPRGEICGRSPKPGTSYGIPFRCLIPRQIDNLLVAGRCISATHEAMASARMIPACMAMGEACGTAAALCAKQNQTPRCLSSAILRDQLKTQGVIL